jgi:small conductance mechanosensitive channel
VVQRDPRKTELLEETFGELKAKSEALLLKKESLEKDLARLTEEVRALETKIELTAKETKSAEEELVTTPFPNIVRDRLKAIDGIRKARKERKRILEKRVRALENSQKYLLSHMGFLEEILSILAPHRRESEKKITRESFVELYRSMVRAVEKAIGFIGSLPERVRTFRAEMQKKEARGWYFNAMLKTAGLGLVLLASFWLVRKRFSKRIEGIISLVDPENKSIDALNDEIIFYITYMIYYCLSPIAVLLFLFLSMKLVGVAPLWARCLLSVAEVWLGFVFLQRINHLFFRTRRVRAVVEMDAVARNYLHRWIGVVIGYAAVFGGIWLLAYRLETSRTNLFLIQALYTVGFLVLFLVIVSRWRTALVGYLRFDLTPKELAKVTVSTWLKNVYNYVVAWAYSLLVIHILVTAALWLIGYDETAYFIFKATVLSIAVIVAGIVLQILVRKAVGKILEAKLREAEKGTVAAFFGIVLVVLQKLIGLVLIATVVALVLHFWRIKHIDDVLLILKMPASVAFFKSAGIILLIILCTNWVVRFLRFAVDTLLESAIRTTDAVVLRKKKTVGPLLKNAIRYVVYIAAGVGILYAGGMDPKTIAGTLAIFGLAVGFGAQSLIKDIITGIFIIFEDSISVGDVVGIGETTGVVEEIGIRVTKIRPFSGVLVSVPNSEISRVTNYNRGWNRAIIQVGIAYEGDVEKAMEVLKEVMDQYARQNPFVCLEPPEVQGVLDFGASEVIIRGIMKVAPMMVWEVERELKRRAKRAFDEKHVEIPFPRRVIYHRHEVEEAGKPLEANKVPEGVEMPGKAREGLTDPRKGAAQDGGSGGAGGSGGSQP